MSTFTGPAAQQPIVSNHLRLMAARMYMVGENNVVVCPHLGKAPLGVVLTIFCSRCKCEFALGKTYIHIQDHRYVSRKSYELIVEVRMIERLTWLHNMQNEMAT